jgi:peptidyl-prolyl cis-trans isomerase SurA
MIIGSQAHAEIIERIVAIVNDQTLLLSDIDKHRAQLAKGGMSDDLLVTDPKAVVSDKQKLIDLMINERLIDSEVQKQNLAVTVERVEQEIETIARSNKISKAQLRQALKEQGVDFAEYQNFIKKRIERHALIERAITSKIKISDEDVAAYYLQQKGSSGKEIFQYRLAHILFVPKGGDVEAAQQRAASVLEKLNSGKSFETLASQYSEDPNFTAGGMLGSFKSGEPLPEIEKAVSGLSVNQTTGVIKTRIGFHIVKLLEKNLIPSPDFEQNKNKIQGYLSEQAFKKQFAFWLTQKRQEAFIRIN